MKRSEAWALKWDTTNALDGRRTYFCGEGGTIPALFKTKAQATKYARETWGYLNKRPDLRAEPHCWRIPKAVRVRIKIEEVTD